MTMSNTNFLGLAYIQGVVSLTYKSLAGATVPKYLFIVQAGQSTRGTKRSCHQSQKWMDGCRLSLPLAKLQLQPSPGLIFNTLQRKEVLTSVITHSIKNVLQQMC